jgi:hypothetical protein
MGVYDRKDDLKIHGNSQNSSTVLPKLQKSTSKHIIGRENDLKRHIKGLSVVY